MRCGTKPFLHLVAEVQCELVFIEPLVDTCIVVQVLRQGDLKMCLLQLLPELFGGIGAGAPCVRLHLRLNVWLAPILLRRDEELG